MRDTVQNHHEVHAVTDIEHRRKTVVSRQNGTEIDGTLQTKQDNLTIENSDIGNHDVSSYIEYYDGDYEQIDTTPTQPLTKNDWDISENDTKCGIGSFQPDWLQKLASKKSYILIYGLIGMFDFALGAYFISTISTVEKRFKMPSRTSGIMTSAWDIGGLSAHLTLSYIGSKGHKTRWVSAGILLAGFSCFMRLIPHIVFGPGQDALELTTEYEQMYGKAYNNSTGTREQYGSFVCRGEIPEEDCTVGSYSSLPAAIMIFSAFILGVGTSMYYTLGIAYMDDNVRKNKIPFLLAIWHFIRMLGPTIGYLIGSYALTQYVDLSLHPTITSDDPRWIGAWWMGWGPIGTILIILATIFAMFPKKLPRAAQRMAAVTDNENIQANTTRSFADFKLVLKRLTKNKILLFNSFSSVCFAFGFIGYWVFMPKYMETQFRQTASRASLITGSIGLICSGLGVMASGIVISKFKPRPRYLAAWNVFVEMLEVIGHFSYGFLNCAMDDLHGEKKPDNSLELITQCNMECDCGPRINYSPVCTSDGSTTFYSPCHAGCTTFDTINGTKIYSNCSCIGTDGQGWATEGACPADCTTIFTIFLVTQCILRFLSSSGRAGNTIIQFRCVKPEDKSVSIGFTEALLALLAFIPGPVVYGMLMDSACIVWGKTCGETGNCWLYDGHRLGFVMSFTASAFLLLGTLLDVGVWYHVKNLQMYDNDNEINFIKSKKKRKSSKKPELSNNLPE